MADITETAEILKDIMEINLEFFAFGHSKRAVKNKFGSKKNLIREEIEDNV